MTRNPLCLSAAVSRARFLCNVGMSRTYRESFQVASLRRSGLRILLEWLPDKSVARKAQTRTVFTFYILTRKH